MGKSDKTKVVKGRPGTVKQFLRELYKKDKNIANDKVLQMVLAKFPTSKANAKTVLSWRKELREEGIVTGDLHYQVSMCLGILLDSSQRV